MKNKVWNGLSKILPILIVLVIIQFTIVTASNDTKSLEKNTPINETELNITTPIKETEPINDTNITQPVNETILFNHTINETAINKPPSISISLEYNAGTPWDEDDDDGIETLKGVIDFSVADTEFNWDVNQEKLCTRWRTYSLDTKEATIACYGAEQCCGFISLAPTRDNWSEIFYSNYGKYGATYNNTISAQVIYADYNTSRENPYAEIYYSEWVDLFARYFDPVRNIFTKIKDLVINTLSVIKGTYIKISATLVDSDEEPIPFQPVNLYVNNTLSDTGLTDILGFVEFELNTTLIIPGEYLLNINYPGQRTIIHQETIQYMPSFNFTVVEILPSNQTNIKILESTQGNAEIGKPVEWTQKIEVINNATEDKEISINVTVPAEAKNIFIEEEGQISLPEKEVLVKQNKSIEFKKLAGKGKKDLEVKYETPAPEKSESEETVLEGKITKNITISSDASVHYHNVLSYADMPEVREEQVKFYWIIDGTKINVVDDPRFNVTLYDTNENGLVDKISWIVPKLSEQLFILEIIPISKAVHLDYDRGFVADIYDYVKAQDNNWTYAINTSEYVRVTFEQELDNTKDITIYARGNGSILVYEYEGNETVAFFDSVNDEKEYKVYLTDLVGTQDTFDLRIVGSVEFDYIVDPDTALSSESQNSSEWRVEGRTLSNNRYYPGHITSNISQINLTEHTMPGNIGSGIAAANGYLYFGTGTGDKLFQMNLSNPSQHIANFSTADTVYGTPAVTDNYVYFAGGKTLFQVNASNVSHMIANFTVASNIGPAVVANGSVFFNAGSTLFQVNSSNVSKSINNYTDTDNLNDAPSVDGDYVYVTASLTTFNARQLNASNISQLLNSEYSDGRFIYTPLVISGEYGYFCTTRHVVQVNKSDISQRIGSYFFSPSSSYACHIYPVSSNGKVYIASTNPAKIFQLNESTMGLIASYSIGSTGNNNWIVASNNTVLVGGSTSLYQFDETNISNLVASYSLGASVRGPMVVDGRIFFSKSTNVLYEYHFSRPLVTLDSPSNNHIIAPSLNTTFNCSAEYSVGLKNLSLYLTNNQNSSFTLNQTQISSGTTSSANWTLELVSGNYTWNCLAHGSDGTFGWGSNRSIIPDTINPVVTIDIANNTNSNDTGLDIEYTATDTYLESCWYSNDSMSTNTTLTDCANITDVTWTEGQHNVTVWANDTMNNVGSADLTFTIDLTNPSFTDISNQTLAYNVALNHDINASDNIAVDCFSVNDTTNFKINCSGYLENNTLLALGLHWVNITVNDTAGNKDSESIWVNVSDEDPPTFTTFANQTAEYGDAFSYDIDATDDSGISCFTVNDTTNFQIGCDGVLQNNTALSVALYDINVTVNDTIGLNSSSVMWVNVTDTKAPAISITAPSNGTNTTNTGLNVNFTASDLNLAFCWYSNDSMSTNTTLTDCANITDVTWTEGQHNVTVWANDSYGNENSSSITFSIDTTGPTFTTFANQSLTSVNALSYDIDATDVSGIDCFIVNDTANFQIDCDGVLQNNTALSVALYDINITVNDTVGNNNSAVMWVNVTLTPSLSLILVTPTDASVTSGVNVTANETFTVSATVTCNNADCGEVNVSLDPASSTVYNFTTCGTSGRTGPSQGSCDTNYSGTTLESLVNVTGGIQNWTVPETGTYTIEVWGAESGSGTYQLTEATGKGAYMSGEFSLVSGQIISIAVGQKGQDTTGASYNGPGGGGGSFVVNGDNPLIIAGGGGASGAYSGYSSGTTHYGQNATITANGSSSFRGGAGGTNGLGGTTTSQYTYAAASGGGFSGNGVNGGSYPGSAGGGGLSYLNGLTGGARSTSFTQGGDGGFGGGGGGTPIAGAGGGGYSGGAGSAFTANTQSDGGGGGGSVNNGTNQNNIAGVGVGDGLVTITFTGSIKSGLITNDTNATPFYLIGINPYNVSLNEGESTTITWTVNATGDVNTTHEFFVYVNQTSDMSISNETAHWNVTIVNFTVEDTTPPTFTDFANQTSDYGTDFGYDINATDASGVDCFKVNDTTNFKINCSGYLENNTELGIDLYWLNISITDTYGNNNSALMWVNVSDTTGPTWSGNKTNLTSATASGSSVYFNITLSDLVPDKYIFSWYNGTTWANDTAVNYTNNQEIQVNKTINAEDITINWTWYVNDTSGNNNQTDVWSITTAIPLRINFISPTPDNGTTQSETNVEINVSIVEENLNEVIYNWNGTNYTYYNDSLALIMNFDNLSALGENDTYAVDVSGNGNDGTAYGGTVMNLTAGKYGGAFEFDGINDYIDVGNDLSLNIISEITLSAWVKSNGEGYIIAKDPVETTLVYNHTGSAQEFTVPAGVSSLTVKVWGAGGAGGTYATNGDGGGPGGYANGTLSVTAGEVLQIVVGEGGKEGITWGDGGLGGYLGGGYGTMGDASGGGGGGLSGIFNVSVTQANSLIIAGGGGAGTGYRIGGGGGGTVGGDGTLGGGAAGGGGGGTQSAGGSSSCSSAGSALQGGNGDGTGARTSGSADGGGGGGGYYGGGGGCSDAGGGGGGSGYLHSTRITNGNLTQGNNGAVSGDVNPPETSDEDYIAGRGVGKGGDNGDGGNGTIVIKYTASSSKDVPYALSTINGGNFIVTNNNINYTANSITNVNDGNWHHLLGVYNNSDMMLYVDGVLEGINSSYSGDLPSNSDSVWIGRSPDGTTYFNGTIDEPRIWNRSLTSDEIYQQYASNLNKFNSTQWYLYVNQSLNVSTTLSDGNYTYQAFATDTSGNSNSTEERTITIGDITAPTFTAIANQTVEYGTALGYDINATNIVGVDCFSVNDTTNFKINCSGYLENNTALGIALYWLNISVNDTVGNNNSALMWVNVSDTTAPTFTAIANQTVEYATALGYDINATDLSNVSCFSVNDTTNFKINCSGYLENNTALSVAQYWLNITVNDSSGNENSNLMWVNVSDTIAPTINITYPLNNTNYTVNVSVLNYTVSDLNNLDKCWYSNNSGTWNSTTVTAGNNFTNVISIEGWNNWTVYCNDTSNNIGSNLTTFFKDTVPPSFTAIANQTLEYKTALGYDINATDANNISCFAVNDTTNFKINCSGYLENNTLLNVSLYWLNITANDTLGNENSNLMFVNVTDTVDPVINTVTVTPTTGIEGAVFNITVNATDNYQINAVIAYVQKPDENNTAIITLGLNNGLYNGSWNSSGKSDGTYVIDVIANDTSGNEKEKENEAVIALASYSVNTSVNSSVNFTTTESVIINATEEADTWLNIITSANVTGSIAIAKYSDNTKLVDPTIVTELSKYIDIIVDNDTNNNISFAEIRIYYTDAEVTMANLQESTLRLYKYNDTSAAWDLVSPGGVETSSNYVWGNVSSFSSFAVFGTVVSGGDDGDDGGGGGTIPKPIKESVPESIYECSQDSDCEPNQYCLEHECYDAECFDDSVCNVEEGETCWNHKCVKLFDMEILEFESPVKIGKFFDFTYFLKAMAEINGDVEIKFWIEKDGKIVTSGQDTIYIGSFEEKTKTKQLFLPDDISSGNYVFYIEVKYGSYTASAHRTIGITVDEDIAIIMPSPKIKDFTQYIIYGLIGVALFALFFIFYFERKKIKKEIIKEERWIKKHRVSILTSLLLIILGTLAYYLKWHKLIANWIPTAILWSETNILPYLSSHTYYILCGIAIIIFIIGLIVLMRKSIKIRIDIEGKERKLKLEKSEKAIRKFLHDSLGLFKTKEELEEIRRIRDLEIARLAREKELREKQEEERRSNKEEEKRTIRGEIEKRKTLVLNEKIKLIEKKRKEKERRIAEREGRRKREREEKQRAIEERRKQKELEKKRRENEKKMLLEGKRREEEIRLAKRERKRNEAKRRRGKFLHDHFGLFKTKAELEDIKRLKNLEISRKAKEKELKELQKEERKRRKEGERIKIVKAREREKELKKKKKEGEKREKKEEKIRKEEERRQRILTKERLKQFNRKRKKEEKIKKQIEKTREAAAKKIRKIQEKEQREKERTAIEEKERQKELDKLQKEQEKQRKIEKIKRKIELEEEKHREEVREGIEIRKKDALDEKIKLFEEKRKEKQRARKEKKREKELEKERREKEKERREEEERREKERRIAERKRRRKEARRRMRNFLHDYFGLFKTKEELRKIERVKNQEIVRKVREKYIKEKSRELEKIHNMKERKKLIILKKKMELFEQISPEREKIRKKMEKIRNAVAQKKKSRREEEKKEQEELRRIKEEERQKELEEERELEKVREEEERIKKEIKLEKEEKKQEERKIIKDKQR